MEAPSLRPLALVAVAAAALFLSTFGLRPLEEQDSLRFPEVAREILETGEWAVLHLHGEPYLLKPPLQIWAVALVGGWAGGIHPWVARLPAALASVGTVLLTFYVGSLLLGRRVGYLAAMILATGTLFFTLSQMTRLDSLYTFFITLALALWLRWRDRPGAYVGGAGIGRACAVFGALAGATLAKGPMAFVFVLPVIAVDAGWRREAGPLRPPGLAAGLTLCALLLSVWVVPLIDRVGWTELSELIAVEIGDRIAGGSNYERPWYHYARGVAEDFLPWTWYLPAAAWIAWRRGRAAAGVPRPLLLWAILPVVLLSFAASKHTRYILPCFPAFALCLGALLVRPAEDGADAAGPDRFLLAWSRVIPITLGIAGIGLPIWFAADGPPPLTFLAGAFLIAGSIAVLRLRGIRLWFGAMAWLAIVASGWYLVHNVFLAVRVPQKGSYAAAAARLREGVAGRPLAAWGFGEEALEFYYGRVIPPFHDPERLRTWLLAHPDARVVAEPATAPALDQVRGFTFREQARILDRKKQPFILLEPVPNGE